MDNELKTTSLIKLTNMLHEIDEQRKILEQQEIAIINEINRRFPGMIQENKEKQKVKKR